jgi:hypothetical protein
VKCELCGRKPGAGEGIVGYSVRECRCSCGGTHHLCLPCRGWINATGRGRYDNPPGKGFYIENPCPTAVKVADAIGGEDDSDGGGPPEGA